MIRAAKVEDAQAIYEAITRSLGYRCTLDMVRRRIAALTGESHCISLAWVDDGSGEVGGFLHALRYDTLHNEGGWDVVSLAVIPELQGHGVGRQLLAALEEMVVAQGGSFVRLNSRVERTEAHGFYEHLGYTCDKLQKRFIKQVGEMGGGDNA